MKILRKFNYNYIIILFNIVSQNECEDELQEELGIEEGVREMAVDDSCNDQVDEVSKNFT